MLCSTKNLVKFVDMHSNVNLDAQLGVLMFVGTMLLLFGLIRGNRRLARVLTAVLVSVMNGLSPFTRQLTALSQRQWM